MGSSRDARKKPATQSLDPKTLVEAFVVQARQAPGGQIGKFRLSQLEVGKQMLAQPAQNQGELVAAVFECIQRAERDAAAIRSQPNYRMQPQTHPDWADAWGARMALLVAVRELLRKEPPLSEETVAGLVAWVADA